MDGCSKPRKRLEQRIAGMRFTLTMVGADSVPWDEWLVVCRLACCAVDLHLDDAADAVRIVRGLVLGVACR